VGEESRVLGSYAHPQVSVPLYQRHLLSDRMRKDVQVLPERMMDGDFVALWPQAGAICNLRQAAGLCRPGQLDTSCQCLTVAEDGC
jgi:hypothetical protein